MGVDRIASPIDVAVSGLRAEALRMRVISNNIANAQTARTDSGEPYRRKTVMLSADQDALGGVSIDSIAPDMATAFKRVYEPGNPDASADGYVTMPNIDLPVEMIHLVTASRSYQANAAVLKRYQEMVNVAIELLR
ncbi:MAG TPA: flagellar basal body rod protein FlgC [Phycisphaerae bacterium]|nr:flagellar basal body rod protein FlgC [Phycisphaerae bacterium]